MKSALIKTGKYREKNVSKSGIIPNHIINSVADLPKYLRLN